MSAYRREIDVAVSAIREAAQMYMTRESKTEKKTNSLGIYDVVTENDLLAEKMIVSRIREAFPEDGFECEETGKDVRNDRLWVIDPIDGTINYVHDIPVFGTQLALVVSGEPAVSVMYLPCTDEMFIAEKGEGAYLNGKRLDVRKVTDIRDCLLAIGDYSKGSVEFRENQVALMDALHDDVGRIKMMGSSCYDFTMFAAGRVDYHARFVRKPWDFLPGLLMVTEAGGVYDRELYERTKLFIVGTSEENVSQIRDVIDRKMVWYDKNKTF